MSGDIAAPDASDWITANKERKYLYGKEMIDQLVLMSHSGM